MAQEGSLDFKLVQRICLLQQALDQAMDSLNQLHQKVGNYRLIESQLAQTEQYANVQQKIITSLQQQLEEKTAWQEQVLKRLITHIQQLVEEQQLELERLKTRIQQSQSEVQDSLQHLILYFQNKALDATSQSLDPPAEVMGRTLTVNLGGQLKAAQEHIRKLDAALTRHQINFAHIDDQLSHGSPSLRTQQAMPPEDSIALAAILQTQRIKLQEREQELEKQMRQQSRLKHRCQLLAAERDYYRQQLAAYQKGPASEASPQNP